MKRIKADAVLITPIDGQTVLKRIEECGRVCYKSEHKITENSAPDFVRSLIKRGHEAVLEHCSFTAKFICDRGVSHEIVRHRVASYCVTGDTVIRGFGSKSWTVKELYDWQFDSQRKGRLSLINARSMDDDTRTIVLNKIKRIYYTGKKPILTVKTESGRLIRCTPDHKLATPDGYKEAQNLSVGSIVLSNGADLLNNPDWIRWYYINQNHTRKETAEFIGCCEATLYKAFKKYGIHKPLKNRPNRRPGRGKKGMFSAESINRLSEAKKGANNPSYKADRFSLSASGGYQDALKRFEKKCCENCGKIEDLEIHHIDKNPRNNTSSNVKVLCVDCHKLWHKIGKIGVLNDKVVSVEFGKIEDVYDVSMSDPYHNFVANGIIAHNCQESTRYCNYSKDGFGSEITVIEPCYLHFNTPQWYAWNDACHFAEQSYFDMLNAGCTAQEARAVLPNSLKTEVVMTANLREWRHFFKLRCSSAAHPQMREVAIILLRKVANAIPVVFSDILKEVDG